MCGFIAQLVEHRTGIAEVMGSNPVEALIFFRLLLSNCLNWKFTAMIIVHFHLIPQYKYELFHIYFTLVNCIGQCHDGASNMMGHKTGVAKRIKDLQPKAYPTHCHGHSLSLRTFAPIVSAHPYCGRKLTSHVMHRACAVSTKMNNDNEDGHCYSFAWI